MSDIVAYIFEFNREREAFIKKNREREGRELLQYVLTFKAASAVWLCLVMAKDCSIAAVTS